MVTYSELFQFCLFVVALILFYLAYIPPDPRLSFVKNRRDKHVQCSRYFEVYNSLL